MMILPRSIQNAAMSEKWGHWEGKPMLEWDEKLINGKREGQDWVLYQFSSSSFHEPFGGGGGCQQFLGGDRK